MMPPLASDWRSEITRRLEIAPTITAMQRYLLFGRRCSAIEESNPAPGDHRMVVTLHEATWTGCGTTADEAMGARCIGAARDDRRLRDMMLVGLRRAPPST